MQTTLHCSRIACCSTHSPTLLHGMVHTLSIRCSIQSPSNVRLAFSLMLLTCDSWWCASSHHHHVTCPPARPSSCLHLLLLMTYATASSATTTGQKLPHANATTTGQNKSDAKLLAKQAMRRCAANKTISRVPQHDSGPCSCPLAAVCESIHLLLAGIESLS